jgi:mannose-1-phosphate guanylyltransferase
MQAGLTVRGEEVRAYWSDLGTPSRYLATVEAVLRAGPGLLERLGADSPFAAVRAVEGGAWAHPEARLGRVEVAGPAYLARGCELGDGARLGEAVSVGERARVGAGAKLHRAAVFDGAEVAPGESLTDLIAWGPHRIPA